MAERVKRRVAAARLAVAFVAATTIAGAAWATAGPPPPEAETSAVDIFQKHKIDSGDIKNGSLLYQDFKAGEVLSSDVFVKYKKAISEFKQDVKLDDAAIKGELSAIKGELGDIKTEVSGIKGELVSGYLKATDADSRYLKLSDDVVRGDGSVFTATKFADGQTPVPIVSVPNLISVEALPGGIEIRIKNIGSSALLHSQCGNQEHGTLQPNASVTCDTTVQTGVMQLIDVVSSETATLNYTFFPALEGTSGLYTVQILIGL